MAESAVQHKRLGAVPTKVQGGEKPSKQPSGSQKYAQKARVSREALNELLAPVQKRIYAGQAIAALSGIAAIWPYIVLTRLGDLLLPAAGGANIPADRVWAQVQELFAAFGLQIGLYFVALMITHLADVHLKTHLQQRILTHLGHAPLSWFSSTSSGRVRKALQGDTTTIHTLIAHKPVEVTAAVVTPLALLVYSFTLNPWLGLLTIATLPLYLLGQMWMTRGMGEKTAHMDDYLAETSARTVEFVDGIEVVKSFGKTGAAHAAFAQAARRFADFYWDWCGPLLKGSSLSTAVISVPVVMLVSLGGGALMVQGNHASTSQVMVCALIALVIPLSLDVITNTTWSYQMAGNAALRLVDLTRVRELQAPPESADSADAGAAGTSEELTGVRFEGISYSYRTEAPAISPAPALSEAPSSPGEDGSGATPSAVKALDGVTLSLAPGTVTALVGPSGSGKSTLATMLARFQDPDEGRVLIDGMDVRAMSEEQLYRTVAFVLQRAQILRASIRDNIRLAVPDADDERVIEAARRAQIWEDIRELPNGLDSVIGKDTNLSGGQKQRIVIARALLTDAPILILDEATANTDPDCAAQIQRALTELTRDRTVLVIGHTAQVVAGADQICIMEGGRITARGTAEELAEHPYWRSLSGGEASRFVAEDLTDDESEEGENRD